MSTYDSSNLPGYIQDYVTSNNLDYNDDETWDKIFSEFFSSRPHGLDYPIRNEILRFYDTLENDGLGVALEWAAENEYKKLVERYYFEMNDEDQAEYGRSIIDAMAMYGYLDTYKLLTNNSTEGICDVLHDVAGSGNMEFLKYVVENCDQDTVEFMNAIQDAFVFALLRPDNYEILDYLIAHGADPEKPNKHDVTPIGAALHTAVGNVKYVLSHGAQLPSDALEFTLGISRVTRRDLEDIITYLVEEKHFDITKPCLLDSIFYGNVDIIPFMVSKGASLRGCKTLLSKAQEAGDKNIIRYLQLRK